MEALFLRAALMTSADKTVPLLQVSLHACQTSAVTPVSLPLGSLLTPLVQVSVFCQESVVLVTTVQNVLKLGRAKSSKLVPLFTNGLDNSSSPAFPCKFWNQLVSFRTPGVFSHILLHLSKSLSTASCCTQVLHTVC